jgi:YfiH family protein
MPPALGDAFDWVSAPWGVKLYARALSHAPHGWTTRQLELRGSADRERAGWNAVSSAAGVGPDQLTRLRQVHGASVHVAGTRDTGLGPSEADIVLTETPDRAVAVQVADCAPVLVADRGGRVVAAAHAGWRGTAADVAGTTVRSMTGMSRHAPAAFDAAIGPCIGPCCYEVGEELIDAFRAAGWSGPDCNRWFLRRDGRLFLDVWTANADQLTRAGIPASQVHVSRLCTACHPDWFYSYRRDGAGTGRLAGFIRPAGSPLSPA